MSSTRSARDAQQQSWWTWTIWRTRWPLRWKIAIQTLILLNLVVWMGDGLGWWNNLAASTKPVAIAVVSPSSTVRAPSATSARGAATTLGPRSATTTTAPTLWLQISGTAHDGAGQIPLANWSIWRNGQLVDSSTGSILTPLPWGESLGPYNPAAHFIVNVVGYNTSSVTCLISIGPIEHSLQTSYGLHSQANCASG